LENLDIVYGAALFTEEMAMIKQVSAIAGGSAIEVYLFGEPAFDQGFQTVINGGQRNGGHMLFGSHKYLNRSGMVALLEKHGEHFFTLPSQPDTAGR
jgi:hypothetical protein